MPLRHPLTFASNGRALTVEDATDPAVAQEIAFLLLTRVGERPMLPEYGTPDPTYDTAGPAAVAATVAAFGPDVTITDVTSSDPVNGLADLVVTFDR